MQRLISHRAITVLAVAALVSACSSTAKQASPRTVAERKGESSQAGDTKRSLGLVDTTGKGKTSRSSATVNTQSVPGRSVSPVRIAPDHSPIRVGIVTEVGNAGAAVGVEFERPQLENAIKAMAAQVNATGGFGGHPIKLFLHEIDQTDQNGSQQARYQEEACTAMTEDEKVFMVLAFSWGTPYAYECYASHRVPVLNRSEYGDQNDLNRYAPYILPTLFLNATRMAKLFPISLAEHGFINDKMGIVSADEPPWRRSGKVLVDGIQARGGKVLDQVYVGTNLDGIASGISSAILRFRQRGIDRVVFWWEGGGAWLLFTRGADAQGWHPRYAISTYDAPKDVQELIPPEQLPGTVGAGFMTARDVSEQVQPPLTEREKACLKLLERRGAKASEDGGVRPDELDVCEMFLLAQQALQPVTGKTLVSSDVAGYIQALGAYPAVQFIGSQFARGRPDGIRKYANFKFIDSCSCFKYSSGWKDIPS